MLEDGCLLLRMVALCTSQATGNCLVFWLRVIAVSSLLGALFVRSLLGSPKAETKGSGVLTEALEYERYREQVNGVIRDRPAYAGHMSDSATGLNPTESRNS